MPVSQAVPGGSGSESSEDGRCRPTRNGSKNFGREAAEKNETKLEVEPVLSVRGVHRQRLPVHRQGKRCGLNIYIHIYGQTELADLIMDGSESEKEISEVALTLDLSFSSFSSWFFSSFFVCCFQNDAH